MLRAVAGVALQVSISSAVFLSAVFSDNKHHDAGGVQRLRREQEATPGVAFGAMAQASVWIFARWRSAVLLQNMTGLASTRCRARLSRPGETSRCRLS
jgi:hypothetical protein